ncbi:MAG: AAA family ATPase [Solirubrobacterales bacterium]|nr:AAA family ATPase [Solirubrobacterales bacterium]OJU94318.1 MAG: hypothetical protein BGO23_02590 [Solirubrobacterales bacterium 67-14]
MSTLADHLSTIGTRRFVGRERELDRLGELLQADSPVRIGYVYGPGGIGKSTLLTAFGRLAADAGFLVKRVDCRRLDPAPGTLERAIGDLGPAPPTLLSIDSFERTGRLAAHLRERVLPSLPAETRLLIAGREPPEAGWRRDGWGPAIREVKLGPLGEPEARTLLSLEGIDQPDLAERVLDWSRGEPLAIALAAEALRGDPDLDPDRLDSDRTIAEALVRHIGDGDETDRALVLAAVARSVDSRLLEELLGIDGGAAFDRLSALSFSEPYGSRVTLHERMRAAIKAVAKGQDPAGERLTRARVAEHLERRIRAGEPELIAEMTALIEDPAVKWGVDGSEIHRADAVRPGDLERAAELAGDRRTELWPWVERFFEEAPDRVVVARDEAGRMAGFAIAVTPDNCPAWADQDPWLGPWLAHAAASPGGREAILWRDTFVFGRNGTSAGSSVVALLNAAATAASGLVNPRYFYGPVDPTDESAVALSRSIGAEHLPGLDLTRPLGRIECHRLDHGPDGMLATVRSLIDRDAGVMRPGGPDRSEVETALRDALRRFHNPAALAQNPLARGEPSRRANGLRHEIEVALERIFGDSRQEILLRETIRRGYLDAEGGHDAAAHSLHLSRSTYFRRLREATDRLIDYFVDLPR